MSYDPMRRRDILRHTPAEKAIRDAILAVEALPADVRLTRAVVRLTEAQERVADYVDGVERVHHRLAAPSAPYTETPDA